MVEKKAVKKDAVEKKESKNTFPINITCKAKETANSGCGGAFYFLGFLGALIYYWGTAPTILDGVIGFFKALVWPAFMVHGLYVFLAGAI